MYQYRVSEVSISRFIPKVCDSIIDNFMYEYMSLPDSEDKWLSIANEYEERWQFPNCVGASNGKHIPLINLCNSGSTYFSYKNFFSIVLLALVDADYKFIYVGIGCQGLISDGGVFKNCDLYKLIANGEANFPKGRQLPAMSTLNDFFLVQSGRTSDVPYVIIADGAFPLSVFCMKPYPRSNLSESKRIFGYRLSGGRRTTKCFRNTFQ